MKLLESLELYKIDILLKTSNQVNLSDIINKLRAVPYIVIARTNEDPRLDMRGTDAHTFSLVTIKFISTEPTVKESLAKIKQNFMFGDGKMEKTLGVLQFIPVYKTIKQVDR